MVSNVCIVKEFVMFPDVFTYFSAVYVLERKKQVFEKFVEFHAMAYARFNTKIGSFHSDNGGEYVSFNNIKMELTY